MSISDIRQKYPQYGEVPDDVLVDSLYNKFYAGKVDRDEFNTKIGYSPEPVKGGSIAGWAKDLGLSALSGATWVPEAVIGLADLAANPKRRFVESWTGQEQETFTRGLAKMGVDFGRAQEVAADLKTDKAKQAREDVDAAFKEGGLLEGLKALGKNPSLALNAAVESMPSMLSLAGLTRLAALRIYAQAAKTAPAAEAAAAGKAAVEAAMPRLTAYAAMLEGGQVAGQTGSGFAQEGTLSGREMVSSIGAGATTAAIGQIANKVGSRIGLEDVEATLGAGVGSADNLLTRVAKGGFREGVLEEAPQSATETMWQNFGEEKPILEGSGQAMVEGLVVGGLLGTAAAGGTRRRDNTDEVINRIANEETVESAIDDLNETVDFTLRTVEPGEVLPVEPQGFSREAEIARLDDELRQALYRRDMAWQGKDSAEWQQARSDVAALQAEMEGVRGVEYTPGPIEPAPSLQVPDAPVTPEVVAPLLSKTGAPFKTERSASLSTTFRSTPGATVVPVEGGFGVQPPARELSLAPIDVGQAATMRAIEQAPSNQEWAAFPEESGTLSIPRAEMPQIKAEHRGAMTQFLKGRGIEHAAETVPADSLKPTQAEFSPAKVQSARDYEGGNRSILVSQDGYVVDGHHQWAASLGQDVDIIRINAPIQEVLQAAREFPSSTTAGDKPVLQNRDRSEPAYIEQMTSIAAAPDYSRLGFSRDFGNGAPVVEPGAVIPEEQMGTTDRAVTTGGRRIPIQYAVVEADQLLPSNTADGSPVAEYEQGAEGMSRAIAGNGRVAGLKLAHQRGKTAEYVQGIIDDAGLHGISADVVQAMKQPVLVRIMPQDEVTADIGDVSNQAGQATLTGAEQAKNDARRVDLAGLSFSENGDITDTTVMQFIRAMPESERSGLMDGGRPGRKAIDRLESAVFATAYGSDTLVALQAQATDTEARTVMKGLLAAASKMARLSGQGEYDIRGLVIEAAEAAVNARRAGQSLSQFIQQEDMTRTPETQVFLEIFADNIRSAKRIGDQLSSIADKFYTEAVRPSSDMLGEVPRLSRAELLDSISGGRDARTESAPANAANTGEPERPADAERSGEAWDYEPTESGDTGSDPFALETQTEEDLAQQDAARRTAEQEEVEAQRRADADEQVDDFSLSGSDSVVDQAESRGQGNIFDSAPAKPKAKSRKGKAEEARQASRDTIGAKEGDVVTPSADIGYSEAGGSYRIDSIDSDGTVHVVDESNASRTSWDRADLAKAKRNGVTFERQPDGSADTEAARLRQLAGEFDFTYGGKTLEAVALDVANHAIDNGRRMTPAETEALADKHDIPVDVADQILRQPFSYEGLTEQASRGNEDAKALLARARQKRKEAEAELVLDPVPTPEPASTPAAIEQSPIEAFGDETLDLRRMRDKAGSLKRDLSDADIASMPLSKIWPKEELSAIEDPAIAAFATAARAEIPTKPRKPYAVKRWVEQVQTLRNFTLEYMEKDPARVMEKLRAIDGLRDFAAKVDLLSQVDRKDWGRVSSIALYPGAKRYGDNGTGDPIPSPFVQVTIDGKRHNFKGAKTAADVVQLVRKMLDQAAEPAAASKMKFTVRGKPGSYWIHKEGDPEYRKLREFDDSKKALAYVRENHSDLVEAWESVKERDNVKKADTRSVENQPRTGADHRQGRDVGIEEFHSTFGLRHVDWGKWVSDKGGERQAFLNDSYDALMDLAGIIELPPKALGLDGNLVVTFGKRGSGWAAAHFEAQGQIINLTRTKGAGSLAHEWFHAMDNYFQRQRGESRSAVRESSFITYSPETYYEHPRGDRIPATTFEEALEARRENRYYRVRISDPADWKKVEGVRPAVEASFAELVNVLDKSPMQKRSEAIDQGKGGYWSSIIERAARSFENYVIAKMEKDGYNNDFLANVISIDRFARNPERYPYLLENEMEPVEAAFGNLFGTIQTRNTERGVAMFSQLEAGSETQGMPIDKMRTMIAPALEILNQQEGIDVVVLQSVTDMPAEALGDVDPSVRYRGAYHNGTVYLFADNIESGRQAQVTLAHELVGHKGILAGATPEEWAEIRRQIESLLKLRSRTAMDIAAETTRRYSNYKEGSDNWMKEFLAVAAERREKRGRIGSIVAEVKAILRKWLRSLGLRGPFSDSDIELIMQNSERNLRARRGDQGMVDGGAPVMADSEGGSSTPASRDSITNTPAFKRWFGESKVVDADGNPQMMYHGTRSDFSQFRAGGRTRGLIFFTASRDQANRYAEGDGYGNLADFEDQVVFQLFEDENPDVAQGGRVLNPERLAEIAEGYDIPARGDTPAELARSYEAEYALVRDGGSVMPVYLSAQNPHPRMPWREAEKRGSRWFKERGYDGVWIEEEGENVLAVFDPTQIKSAIGNNGDFDPSNPDIRFSQNQAPVTGESVRDMARALEQEYGLDKLSMFHRQTSNTIVVSNIAVPRESQGSGIGTAVMHRIADYADQHGARIALSPGLSDGDLGTTSRARLVRFYKRFGFVENKGRNKDFALSEGMYREPAAGGATSPGALFSQESANTDPSLNKIADRVLAKPGRKTIPDRIREAVGRYSDNWGSWFRQGVVDQYDSIAALEIGLYSELRDAKDSAYKSAAFSKNSDTVMNAAMVDGALSYKNGSIEVVEGTKGLMKIFEPLAKVGLVREWELWAGAVRAKRLMAEGRENLYTQDDIDTILSSVTGAKLKAYQNVHAEWTKYNRGMLDFAQDSGLINAEERALWEHDDYVPFHRVSEMAGGEHSAPRRKMGISGQRSGIERLAGGVEKISIIESMVRNTAALIDSSMKNVAMQRTIGMAVQAGVAEPVQDARISNEEAERRLKDAGIEYTQDTLGAWKGLLAKHDARDGTVSVSVDGKAHRYLVNDPVLLRSMVGLGPTGVEGIMRLLRIPKVLLTEMVTADPSFAIRNLIRDTLSTWVTVHSDVARNPLSGAIKGIVDSYKESPALREMRAQGVGGGGFYDTSPEGARLYLERMSGNRSVRGSLSEMWRSYKSLLGTTETANRLAVYENTLAAGGSRAEAAYQAMDVLNFSRHGEWKAVRMLIQMVPFMNARIQGLDRLHRGAKEGTGGGWAEWNRQFAMKGIMLTSATLALLAANWDNDDYWDLPEWERDTYYHFFVGGEHFRLPKPFEVGAVFSTIPERMFEQFRSDANMKLLGSRMLAMFADTFAMDPTPQFVKPALEVGRNRASFTGNQIVSQGMQYASPEAQYSPYTSKTFIEIADAMPDSAPAWMRSPVKLEHLFRGYMGTLGGYSLSAADYAAREITNAPARPRLRVQDVPVASSFIRDGVGSNKQVGRVYDMSRDVGEVYSAIQKYRKEGRMDKAAELRQDNMDKLRARLSLNKVTSSMSDISSQIKKTYDHPALTPDQKRERIDELTARRNKIAKSYEERYRDRF